MKYLLFIFIPLLSVVSCIVSSDFSQPDYERVRDGAPAGMPNDPGSCYAKCLMQDKYEISYEELILFTGDEETTDAAIKTINHVISPSGTDWVKKKVDENCMSSNPNDCLVWCLVDSPAQIQKVTIVTDTTTTEDFQIINFEKRKLVVKGGFADWREVICKIDIDNDLIRSVQEALKELGYYEGLIDGEVNAITKEAMSGFQRINGYPVGQFDLESLEGLGVKF